MPTGPLRVGVVSPHELVLTGLVAMLERHPARAAVHEVGDAAALDVLLYDAAGLERSEDTAPGACPRLDQLLRSGVRVVAVARPHEPSLTAAAVEHGVAGVVPMDASAPEMLDVLDRVVRTGTPTARHVDARLLHLPHGLTVREFEVLALVAAGLSNNEIAERLYVSVNTVKTYVRAAYRKIGVERRSQAVIWCSHHGVAAS